MCVNKLKKVVIIGILLFILLLLFITGSVRSGEEEQSWQWVSSGVREITFRRRVSLRSSGDHLARALCAQGRFVGEHAHFHVDLTVSYLTTALPKRHQKWLTLVPDATEKWM